MYTEVSLSQVRRNIFGLVNRAFTGAEVWVADKGRRVRPTAAIHGKSVSRIAQLDLIDPKSPLRHTFLTEVVQAWESDWADL